MSKLFRKIRQRLIAEGRLKRYLLYAVGEIILVVVGILIALQINNWNELRKQSKVEIEILEGIREDLLRDTIDLNYNIDAYRSFMEIDSLAIDYFTNPRPPDPEIIQILYSYLKFSVTLVLHDTHFNQARQRGLSIISNAGLREQINRLYEFDYEALKLVENDMPQNFRYDSLLANRFEQLFYLNEQGVVAISAEKYQKIIQDRHIGFILMEHRNIYTYMVQDFYLPTLQKVENLIRAIETELERLR